MRNKYFPIFGLLNSKGEPMILGFAGAARSGKDTAGAYFVEQYMVLYNVMSSYNDDQTVIA